MIGISYGPQNLSNNTTLAQSISYDEIIPSLSTHADGLEPMFLYPLPVYQIPLSNNVIQSLGNSTITFEWFSATNSILIANGYITDSSTLSAIGTHSLELQDNNSIDTIKQHIYWNLAKHHLRIMCMYNPL